MSQLSRRRVRLSIDTSKFDTPQDALTSGSAKIWNGSPVQFELALKYGSSFITDLSNLIELTLQIKATENGERPTEGDAPLVSKTIDSFDDTLNAATWDDGTKQHAVVALSGAEANLTVGKKWLVIVASIVGIADPVTLSAGFLDVEGDGYDSGAGEPPDPAASYLNTEQSDARYMPKNLIVATVDNAAESVDVDISALALAAPPTQVLTTVLLPANDSAALPVRGVFVVSNVLLRVHFGAAAPAAGYKVTVFAS